MKSRFDFTTDQEYYEYLRFYYAGLAMQGYLASWAGVGNNTAFELSARNSLKHADALIAELKKPIQYANE